MSALLQAGKPPAPQPRTSRLDGMRASVKSARASVVKMAEPAIAPAGRMAARAGAAGAAAAGVMARPVAVAGGRVWGRVADVVQGATGPASSLAELLRSRAAIAASAARRWLEPRLAAAREWLAQKLRPIRAAVSQRAGSIAAWIARTTGPIRRRASVVTGPVRIAWFRVPRRIRIPAASLSAAAALLVVVLSIALGQTWVVNDTSDRVDANIGDRRCDVVPATTLEECTLRAAIQEANARAGADVIQIEPGLYAIEIAPLNENAANVGDFEILDPVTIEPAPGGLLGDVIIDGGTPLPSSPLIARGLDRLFEIHPGAGDVTFRNVILQNGYSPEAGGAIQNWSLGKLTLEGVTVRDSYAEKAGGGLNHADLNDYTWTTEPPNLELLPHGRVDIKASTFTGNGSGGGSGGAINNVSGGTITISQNSLITLNPGAIIPDPLDPEEFILADPSDYPLGASAIANQAAWGKVGTLKISDSTISLNATEGDGAGIVSLGDSVVEITNSIITQNRTAAGGAGLYTEGGIVKISGSTISKNQAANGGGLYSGGHVSEFGLRGRFEISSSQIFENIAENGGGLFNGGDAQLYVTDTTFTKNHSSDHGGAITSEGRSNMVLSRVAVTGNTSNGYGGGVATHAERQHTIFDSTFTGNKAGVPVLEDDGTLSDDIAGGGALYTDGGPLTILRTTFDGNTATEEGGAMSLHNLGDIEVVDSTLSNNRAFDGGAVENSAEEVTFRRVTVTGNRANGAGGGIYNTSSGEFFLLDSTIRGNSGVIGGGLANAPDNAIIVRGSLFANNTARIGFTEAGEIDENAGRGGGIMSFADGDSLYENITISGNKAAVAGGGLFHDADGELRLVHATVWRNSAPVGGGIGVVESDFSPPIPPAAITSVVLKNSIVGGSLQGGNCDWYIRSEGGNLETGEKNTCFLAVTAETAESPIELGVRDRRGDPDLWALADNGGPTLTHALQYGSLAIDSSAQPCSIVDQRGTPRPQNGRCDAGAFEFVGPPPAEDTEPPQTIFEYPADGPFQDGLETMAFRFRGTDNITDPSELNFECRFLEIDLVEEPDVVAPWDPVPPELMWNGCSSPWSVPLPEEGLFTFEVRATDRADNTDPTPISQLISGVGMEPPDTIIVEAPGLTPGATVPPQPATTPQTNSRSALFSFMAVSDFTPSQFAEYECRLDSRDPEMWLECFNPTMFTDLTTGLHTFEVRALAGEAAGPDPSPARYTWRVGPDPDDANATPINCDEANVVLTPSADGWVDQVNPLENYLFQTELDVRSGAVDPGTGQPLTPQNARAFIRFALQSDAPDCELVSAELRIYSSSHTEGRTIEVVPLAETWKESTLNWVTQPDPVTGAAGATSPAGEGYRSFNVKDHIEAIFAGAMPSFGWVIRDATENDPDGGDQTFISREQPQDPPEITLPELELRFEPETANDTPAARDESLVDKVVTCGEVITESTRLLADVTGCLGEGIAIGAPNIILDLNGHTVASGLIIEPGEEDALTPGIRSGYANVEIRNGVVTNYGYGVLLGPNSVHTEVHHMTLVRNALTGVQLFDADNGRLGARVHDSLFDSNGETGLQLMSGTEGAVIENNRFVSNGMSIHVFDSHRNLIRNNDISGIILDPALDSDAGIVVENGSRSNVLENNQVSDTGDAGVKIQQGSHGNSVIGGVYVRNGDAGVIVQDSDAIVVDGVLAHRQSDGGVVLSNSANSVVKNSDLRYNPSGIDASGTNNLIVENNDVSNSLQDGIALGEGVGMTIRNNVANHTGGTGISVASALVDALGNAVGGGLIEGNTANENAADGLAIVVGKHTVRSNTANNNAGYGIDAGEDPVPGEPLDPNRNIDGGGNSASGNHSDGVTPGLPDAIQCIGVACETGDALLMTPADLTAPETTLTSTPPLDTGNMTAAFTFTGTDGPTGDAPTALIFECRIDAPPDPPLIPEEPDLEPPDPNDPPDLPEFPEGEFWAECVSPQTYLSLEPAMQHHFEVRAVDQAGNFDLTPEEYTWTISAGVEEDGTEECGPGETLGVDCFVAGLSPETRITMAPGELITDVAGTRYDTTNRAATFGFVGSDNLSAGYNLTFECRVYYEELNDHLTPGDIGADPNNPAPGWQSCDSPELYTNLEYGGHIFQVRSIDLGGNRDVEPAWHAWWVHPPPPDTTAPDTEILTGPDPTTVSTTATFTFSGTDNQTPAEELAYECRLDGLTWYACSSPVIVSGLSPATDHVFQVRAIDLSGNVDDVNEAVDNPSAPDLNDPRDGVPAAYTWTVTATPVNKTVFCGQRITQSIIVNNNLGDCIGHGLIVGASGITIDLNGKTIDGKSLGAAILNNGYDSVTIRNGRLTDFDYGVMLNAGASLNIIEGVTVQLQQEAAVGLGHSTFPEDPALAPSQPVPGFRSGVDSNILRSNTLVSNTRGVWLLNGAQDNLVRGNLIGATSGEAVWIQRATQNLIDGNSIQVASKAGVLIEGSTDNIVTNNTIADAGTGVLIGATTTVPTGIESTGNLVRGNTLSETAGPAVEIDSSSGNQVIENVATLIDSYAIELYRADNNVIRGNEVSGNKGGVSLRESSGNTIEGNDASNSDSTGITLESQSFGNALLNNVSNNNVGGGIYIGDEAPTGQGTLVEGNTTNANKGVGIAASKPAHIFRNNIAFDNDSWGMNVGDPSNGRANLDAGGNRAQGNKGPLGVDLKPQQCYNITCLGGEGGGDEIAPNTSLLETPLNPSSESVATFRFSGADNASPVTFECRFNSTLDTDWEACASPASYSDLANDTYTFEVRALDVAGNRDATPEVYTWAVELGDFAASIDATPDKVTVDTTATFAFSANRDSGVTFNCLQVTDGTDLSALWATAPSCTSPVTYSNLLPGDHEFWVRATDAASTFDTKLYAWTIGPAPVAAEVNCGQILMESTRLLNDLVDCGGHGLIVGRPGITIDLDGHVIDGLGLDAGILNNGHADVTIKNGLVTQFLYGVQLNPGTVRNVIHSMRIEGNEEAGIALSDADLAGQGNLIRDNSIVANEIGVALYTGTRHTVIRNNTFGANLGEGAIVLEFASENLIELNQIGQSSASGISMLGGGNNVVTDNVLKDNRGIGIMAGDDLLTSNSNLVQRNTITGGQGGVLVAGVGNTILNNSGGGSTGPGVTVELATDTVIKGNDIGGIVVSEATGTLIEGNNASGTLGSGIAVGELSTNSIVRNNTASGNSGDGIEVTDSSVLGQGTVVEGNTTDANSGDGILVEGSGHVVRGNVAQLNGGWGIYSIGAQDGGGNLAAGNMEPEQCFGVVCTIGIVPGAPETWIVSGPADVDTGTPGIQSNSRNASFTYMGSDTFSPITEIVFECRIDNTNPLAWEDCEYPAEFLNLSPGEHTLDIRAIDMLGQGQADPTPATFTWTYVPLPTGVAPQAILDVVPETPTFLVDAIFTFHSNEPDVTFQCKVDMNGYAPCGFESAHLMGQGAFEWALAEFEVGQHTFYVRAIDFEGNIGTPTTFTWELLGVNVVFTDGPGFVPAVGGPLGDPATGGPSASTSAEITFEANVADAVFWCRFDSLDPAGYFPCESPFRVGPAFTGDTAFPDALLPGDHMLEVYGESETMASAAELEPAIYEWEVVDPVDTLPPDTTIERAPSGPVTGVNTLSSTIFEFTGIDDLTPDFLLTFECQVTNGTAPPNEANWVACVSPFSLLEVYSYADPEMSLSEHTFYVRAVDTFEPEFPDPTQPAFEGNVDPTPASHTWTPLADQAGPITTISAGPADGATVGSEPALYTFFAIDNATPLMLLEFECAAYLTDAGISSAVWTSCESPAGGGYDISGLEPGAYTVAVRAVDLAGNVGVAATRTVTVAAAPIVTFLSGPAGRLDPISGAPDGASGTENAIFTFTADRAGSTFECSFDGSDFVPCGGLTNPPTGAAWVVDNGEHAFAVRATNPQGIVSAEVVYEWLVELAPDTTSPTATFTSGPESGTLETVATFTFSGTDNRTPSQFLTFECALDSTTAWNSCTSPEQYSDLVRGTHVLRLRAVDAAGNIQGTPAEYTWIVAPPPVATILSGPGVEIEQSTDRSATFTFTSDVTPATFHCWLDGKFNPSAPGFPSQPAPCTSGVSYSDLGLGDHLFAVRAVDQFGNIGVWEDTEFRVMPSEARLTSVPATGTSTTATFEFTSEPLDPSAAFYCSLDGRPFGPCTSAKTYTNLFAGEHVFQVQTLYTGVDWTGMPFEHTPIPAVHTWTVVDNTPPDTTIEFGPPTTTLSTSAYLQVSSNDQTATIDCTLTGPTGTQQAECEPGTVTELTDLVPGLYTLTAAATDLSGNVDPSPATYSWTIGTPSGPPNTPVSATPVTVTIGNVTVQYFSVETAGTTTVDLLSGGPSLPEGYGGGATQIYDISTTALYSEPVSVCITYDPASFDGIMSLRLLHFDGSLWLDITTLHDPFSAQPRICSSEVEGFSLFAIAAASSGMPPETYILSGPEGPLGAEGLPTSTSGSATFKFWTDQADAIIQCSIDGSTWFYCESPITVGPFEAGSQEFYAQAINAFGWMDLTPAIYEWEVLGPDVTPPTTLITRGPPEGSFTPNYISTFEFTGTDDFTLPIDLAFECTLDGVNLGGCEPTLEQIEVFTAGEHTLLVQAIDAAGNIDPVGDTRTWTVVDMSGPDTEILIGPEEETTETSATFEFQGFELLDGPNGPIAVDQFECALDQADFAPCTSPHTIAGPLGGGVHVFHVRAVDLDGNRDISPEFYEWMIIGPEDTTPPETFITVYPDPANSGPDVTFAFASNEPVEEFECAIDQASLETAIFEPCSPVMLFEALSSGTHTLWVRAIDMAIVPNTDPTPAGASRGFPAGTVDSEPFTWVTTGEPDTTVTDGPSDPTGSYTAIFEFESDQAGATFQCSVNGSAFVPCTSPYQAGPFLPGELGEPMQHELEVRAVNQFRNADGEQVMDLSPAIYTWNVQDVTPPMTVFLGADGIGPEQFLEPGLRFTFRADDDLGSTFELIFECAITNVSEAATPVWEQCGEPWANDSFFHEIHYADYVASPGNYTFQVRAVDLADNADTTPAPEPAYEFVIEGEPETTITSTVPDLSLLPETTSTSITISFSGTGASFLCALDTTIFSECPGGVAGQATYTDLPYGEHLFQAMALGAFGTPDASPAEFEWITGTDVAPDVTIDFAPPATGGIATSGIISFSSTDPLATFLCTLDSGLELPCASPWPYADLLAGEQNPHSFEVTATRADLLPSVTLLTAAHEWVITDEAAPVTILLAPLPTDPSANEVTFTFTGTDNGTIPANLTFDCSLDGAAYEPCSSPWTIPALTGGAHTFDVRATDLVPLTDGSPATHAWDVIAPPLTIITNTTPLGVVEAGAISTSATGQLTFFDQPGSTYECRLDPVDAFIPAWNACVSPVDYDLANGAHVLEVRARTLPLNGQPMLESPAAEYEWTIDAADALAPDTLIQLAPADGTTSTSATFLFTGTDNLTATINLTFECSLDGAAFADCQSGGVYPNLPIGSHTFAVRASDTAVPPNVDGSPAEHAWTIVAADANTSIGTGVEVLVGGASVTFESVTAAGVTSVDTLTAGATPDLPAGYFATGALFYEVSTTATYAANVTVCLPYATLADARVLHHDGSAWLDVSLELQGSRVCGVVGSLSPFAVVEASATVAPDTDIVQSPADPTIQSTADGAGVQFQFTSTHPLPDFECRLDAQAWSSCDSPYPFNALFGEHTLRVRAVSQTGVVDVSPDVRTWTVLARPVATIQSGPVDQDLATIDIENESQSATFTFSSDQLGSSFECRLTGETTGTTWAPCASGVGYDNLGLGEYTFEVQAINAAGHASFVPAQYEWEVADLSAPVVSIDSGPSGTVDATSATFTFSADEPAVFLCSLDGAPYALCASGTLYTGFSLGLHSFSVQAEDLSESANLSAPVTRAWTVADLTAPVLTVSTPPTETSLVTMAFSFTATDNWAGTIAVDCRIDGGAYASCTSPKSYSGLSDGQHTVDVRATDSSAHATTVSRTWTVVDTAPPAEPDLTVQSGSLIFTFSSTDDHTAAGDLDFQCRLDSAAYAPCTSPVTYSSAELAAMTPGGHTFQVRAVDEANNVGQPTDHTFTVADTTAPNTSITGNPQATTTNTTASFTFTGSDDGTAPAGLTYECALDGAALAACSSPKEYTGLAVGAHTFEVVATDAADNTDASPATYSWEIEAIAPPVDTTAPETTISANPPATTTETSASFSFAGTDAVTPAGSLTFECQLDTGAYAACTTPKAYTNVAVGAHTFRVRAIDAAGNTDQSSATFSWTVQSATVNCGAQQTLTATADAWIDSGSPSSNKGSDSILKVMSKSGGNLRALVQFSLPTMPQGCSVASATLRIYAKSAAGGRTIQAYQLAGPWTEGGVTWANQPQTTGGAVTVASGTGYRDWNVAGMVQSMYSTANNGFLIRDASENQDAEQQFHSRSESSNRPQLVLTFGTGTPPPPPGGGQDTAPPDTTITGSPLAATPSASATFTFSGVDAVTPAASLTFECQLDVPETSAWTACASPQNLSGLAVGPHTFRVRAKDAAGNVDLQPAVYTWTIDQTAPETIITLGPPATTPSTSASFNFQSPETGTTFACSLDSAPFTSCVSPASYTNLSVAPHTFQVRATDAAGNADLTPASYPWTVQAGGTPVDCGPSQTLAASADAWIEQGSPSNNKGTDGVLKVMSKSGNNLRALVGFSLPTAPQGCVIDAATLRLYAGSSASGRTLQALLLNAAWTENGVTWANQPATTGAPATTQSATGYMQWNVATIVQSMYSAGTSNGFLIRDATEGQDAEQQIYSREKGENPPQLVLTFKAASGGGTPPAPLAPTSCGDGCQASQAATISLQPATLESARLLGILLALTLAAFAIRPSVMVRRPPSPPALTL